MIAPPLSPHFNHTVSLTQLSHSLLPLRYWSLSLTFIYHHPHPPLLLPHSFITLLLLYHTPSPFPLIYHPLLPLITYPPSPSSLPAHTSSSSPLYHTSSVLFTSHALSSFLFFYHLLPHLSHSLLTHVLSVRITLPHSYLSVMHSLGPYSSLSPSLPPPPPHLTHSPSFIALLPFIRHTPYHSCITLPLICHTPSLYCTLAPSSHSLLSHSLFIFYHTPFITPPSSHFITLPLPHLPHPLHVLHSFSLIALPLISLPLCYLSHSFHVSLSLMAFSSLAKICGEVLTAHSLPALFFFFLKWRSAHAHQLPFLLMPGSVHNGSAT